MIGIPVQVFRAGAAPSIALAIVGIIRLFNKETNNELLRYNKQLEGMVTDRTQKLMNINVQLEDEIKIHKKMEQQLHLLTSRMFSIKEDERVMISREIHDELGQIMTRLKIDLSLLMEDMLESKCDKVYMEKLKSLSGYIDRIFKRIKDIAKFLRPKELDSLGLISAIKTYINDFQKHTGISCSLQYLLNCDERDIKFDDTTEIAIFRIIQEALTNIVRHSKANEACVIIENSIGFLRFSIKDNGRGISDSEISESGSLGLLGMKERAHMIGGEMNIVSAKDNGAVITLSIPLGDISEYDKNRYS
jgi:signal transduction histidine kinase